MALQKLEWPLLLQRLAGHCQTSTAREDALTLVPALSKAEVEQRWGQALPLKKLVSQGYVAPIGELHPIRAHLRAAGLGQVLAGPELAQVGLVLEATRKVYNYCTDLQDRCRTLQYFRGQLYPLPRLAAAIAAAITPEGELKDDASPELLRLRKSKISLRRRIEEALRKIMHEGDLLTYLQDDFFTVRNERYVLPMRLDGRGRVKGHILDTSTSGQTLFIEPASIMPLNDQLQELELEEKLEILRIFRDLTAQIAAEPEILQRNFDELTALDRLGAEAMLAFDLDAGSVTLVDSPELHLVDMRHPLLMRPDLQRPVGNDAGLMPEQHALIISGPNAGGKTVVLKAVGLMHLMAKAGLLLPAAPESRLYLFRQVWIEMGDAQNLSASLSTFSGHLLGLKPILENARENDLVLLDELAAGTDPESAAAIGRAVLEDIVSRRSTVLVTTHFDALKGLALADSRFRNGSMEFSLRNLRPTYRLILDVPGQSYGLEVAEQIGIPPAIIARARALRGHNASALDAAVNQLMQAREEAHKTRAQMEQDVLSAQAEKTRWQNEVELLQEQRRRAAKQIAERYEDRLREQRLELEELVKQLRKLIKDGPSAEPGKTKEDVLGTRRQADQVMRGMESALSELTDTYKFDDKLPGKPASFETLKAGDPVFVLPLKKTGNILRIGPASEGVEVEVGVIKLRVSLHDLRLLSPGEAANPKAGAGRSERKPQGALGFQHKANGHGQGDRGMVPRTKGDIAFTLPTSGNTLDLRGKDVDGALTATWNFIDRALLRGEAAIVIIHGHGEGALKAAIRDALKHDCPYDIKWRPGLDQEGGDGVTVVALK